MHSLKRSLRIDKGSPAGALYLGAFITIVIVMAYHIHIMKAYIFLCLVIL